MKGNLRLWAVLSMLVTLIGVIPRITLALSPGDLVGTWIIESAYPQGMLVDTATFTSTAGEISGEWNSILTHEGPMNKIKGSIKQLKWDGKTLSFRVSYGGSETFWTGQFISPDQLRMQWIGDDGHLFRTRFFRRVSQKALAALQANAPSVINHKLPLPEPREVPFNGLALTPPMGWSSWNYFKESVNDKTVREVADAMVASGLRDAGYVFVNIDDGWQGLRDDRGILHPNAKFPDMKALADYVHTKGLKLGIYSSPGPITCTGYLGSHGHETQDARTFAEWGIDIIRYDWCIAGFIYEKKEEMQALYQKMGEALQAAGRPIVYTLCQYGLFDVSSWGRQVGGNMWRTGDDMIEGLHWPTMSERFEGNGKPEDAGPGGWNDPDHMVIGMGGMTVDEQRTHMALWAIQAAPLILGNDVRTLTPEVKNILLNKEVIAIDQDALGKQERRALKNRDIEVWTKPLQGRSTAVALFNRSQRPAAMVLTWAELGLKGPQDVRDLWQHVDLGKRKEGYSSTVPAHGSVLLRISAAQ